MNVISATEARRKFFDILNDVIFNGKEYVIEKKDAGTVKISSGVPKRSPEEIRKILADVRKVFAKSKRRKYWSVLDTPAWEKKERKYLEDLSRGIVR